MVFSKISANSVFNSLKTNDLGPSSNIGHLVAISFVWMLMFMLGEWQEFNEEVYNNAERPNQNTDTPLLRSKSVVGINTEGHTCEGDQQELKNYNDAQNGQEDFVSAYSFKDV